MPGLADIHSHFVYGLDDGAKDQAEMFALLDMAHAQGITALVATPHVTPGIRPFDWDGFGQRLEEARLYCRSKGYALTLHAGAELLYTPAMLPFLADDAVPTLAGTDSILLEFAPEISLRDLETAVSTAERAGYRPILAHAERYSCLLRGKTLARLKDEYDMRVQVNATTVLVSRGFFRDLTIQRWFKAGLVDFIASDAHDTASRPFKAQAAFEVLAQKYGSAYAQRLLTML